MPVAKFHIITPSSLDTSVFILERRHRNVTCGKDFTQRSDNGTRGFPSGSVVMNMPVNAVDMGLIPDQEDPTCLRATKPMGYNC